MMAVSILYEEMDSIKAVPAADYYGRGNRGLNYVREYLRDYRHKQYQSEVKRCLEGCYEVLVECREGRGDPVDHECLQSVKKVIADEMAVIWHGKGRKKKEEAEETEPEVEVEPEVDSGYELEPEPDSDYELEPDWEERFAAGEFDLESKERDGQ